MTRRRPLGRVRGRRAQPDLPVAHRNGREPGAPAPPGRGVPPAAPSRPLEWAVVLAISPQLRDRYPGLPLSLEEVLQFGARQRQAEADREAES
jgi:hypothetical protein